MWQQIIVLIVVVLAAVYVGRKYFVKIKSAGDPEAPVGCCDGGCAKCAEAFKEIRTDRVDQS